MAVRRPVGTFDRTRKNVNRLRNMANLGSAGAYDNPGDEIAAGDAALARAAIDSERRRPLQSRTSITVPYAPGKSPEEQAEAARAAQEANLARIEEQYPATTYEGAGIDRRTGKSYDPIEVMLAQLLGAEPGGLPDLTKLQQMDADMLELVTTSLADAQDRRLMLQQAELEYANQQQQQQRQQFFEEMSLIDMMLPPDSVQSAALKSDLARRYGDILPEGLGDAVDPRPRLNRIVSRGVGSVVDALSGRQSLSRRRDPEMSLMDAAGSLEDIRPGVVRAAESFLTGIPGTGGKLSIPTFGLFGEDKTAQDIVESVMNDPVQNAAFMSFESIIDEGISAGASKADIVKDLMLMAGQLGVSDSDVLPLVLEFRADDLERLR